MLLFLLAGTQLFKDVESGRISLPDEDELADMYEAAVDILEAHQLLRYEVSNFAKRGRECRHNQWYWKGGEYIGVGPGAHSRFRARNLGKPTLNRSAANPLESVSRSGARQARIQTLEPDAWMREVEREGHGTRSIRCFTEVEVAIELLASSLRTREGLTHELWQQRNAPTAPNLAEILRDCDKCEEFVNDALLIIDERGLRLSPRGISLTDYVLSFMVAQLQEKFNTQSNKSR